MTVHTMTEQQDNGEGALVNACSDCGALRVETKVEGAQWLPMRRGVPFKTGWVKEEPECDLYYRRLRGTP